MDKHRYDVMIDPVDEETSRWLHPGGPLIAILGVASRWLSGMLMVGLFAGWMVFKLWTPDGVIVLENVPKDSEILVDGNKITFTWPGGGKPVEIRAVPGQHHVEVNREGFRTFGRDVTIKSDESEEVRVRLEPPEPPLAVVQPEPGTPHAPEPTDVKDQKPKPGVVSPRPVNDDTGASGFVSLFNGKDLSGWTFPLGHEDAWGVLNGVIRGTVMAKGGGSTIATARSDFRDFHLRMEIRDGGRFMFRSSYAVGDEKYYAFSPGAVRPSGSIIPLGTYMIRTGGTGFGQGATPFFTPDGLHELKTPQLSPLTKDTWHAVEIIAVGNEFKMKVEGREVSAFKDTQSRLKQGQIAIHTLEGHEY